MGTKSYSLTICMDGILPSCVDINSEELCICYAGTPSAHGLQSNFEDGSLEYQKQIQLCDIIADNMRELAALQEKYINKIDKE